MTRVLAALTLIIALIVVLPLTARATEPTPAPYAGPDSATLEDLLIYLEQANAETQAYRESVLAALTETNQRFEYAVKVFVWILTITAFVTAISIITLFAQTWGKY